MMQSTEHHSHALPRRPSLAARIAWRTGWVLLALITMALTYGALVYTGH